MECKSCGKEISDGKLLCNNCLPTSIQKTNDSIDKQLNKISVDMKKDVNPNGNPKICTAIGVVGWIGIIAGILCCLTGFAGSTINITIGLGSVISGILFLGVSKIISLLNSINNKLK